MRHREYVLRNAQVIRLEFFFCAIDHEALLDGLQTVIIRVGSRRIDGVVHVAPKPLMWLCLLDYLIAIAQYSRR